MARDAADECDEHADYLADQDAADEAAELRGEQVASDARQAMLQALNLADPAPGLFNASDADLMEAADDYMAWGECPTPLQLLDAMRGRPDGLLKWMRGAIDRAAERAGSKAAAEVREVAV